MATKDTREIVAFSAFVAAAVVVMLLLRPVPPGPVIHTPLLVPADQAFHPRAGLFDVSRDGSLMVYRRLGDGGASELWARRFPGLRAVPIDDTEGALLPAISPDGREVAFTAAGDPARVRVVGLRGGAPRTIADSAAAGGARWSPDGAWVFYTNSALGLSRAPAAGGSPEVLTHPDTAGEGEVHWGVEVLPGARAIAYTSSMIGVVDPRIEVLNLETGEVRDLWSGSFPRYSETGHLIFLEAGGDALLVARFDADSLELRGPPTPVAVGLAHPGDRPLYSVSQTGTVLYARVLAGVNVRPVWVDRDGTARDVDPEWSHRGHATYSSLALSPAEDRLVVSIPSPEGTWDLWVKPLGVEAGPLARITFEGSFNYRPSWSGDGRSLVFISDRAGQADLWTEPADGTGAAARILDRPNVVRNGFRSPDGDWIVFREGEAPVADIWAIRPETGAEAMPVVVTDAGERSPALSPNGRWLAYTSIESGEWQVWVTAFGQEDPGKWQVSPDGGEEPLWARGGRELFYRNWANELVAVQVGEEPTFELGQQRVLFSMEGYLASDGRPQYDVSADGRRFVMLRLEEGGDIGLMRADHVFERSRPAAAN